MTKDDLGENSGRREAQSAQEGSLTQRKKWRVGLLGTGYIAEYHAKALQVTPDVRLTAVCDRAISRAKTFAADYGVEAVYASLDEMLAGGQVDAVHVLTPPDGHFGPAERLLNAGVAAFLEKPMGISAQECQKLVSLSREKSVPLGVAHNFLFSEPYEQLRSDLQAGVFGQIDHVAINWFKPLGQLIAGPFDIWMLRNPTNILFEIGPHPFGQLLDLMGKPEALSVTASNETELPTGVPFYRRWHVHARRGQAAADVNLSFVPGFTEFTLHLRGTTGSASVDFERNTYLRHQHVPRDMDFDRYTMLRNESRALTSQARSTLLGYVSSKVHASARGTPYGYSIAKAVERFYHAPAGVTDSRLSASLGHDVIALCEQIRESAPTPHEASSGGVTLGTSDTAPSSTVAIATATPNVLVLGATGFIGKELVRYLVAKGKSTRVLVRSAGKLPSELVNAGVHVVVGDCANARDLDVALEGAECVVHLARSNVKSWSDYQKHEIAMTRLVAERAIAKGIKRFIYSGTIDSYYAGPGAGTITEETPLDSKIEHRNLYARAKAASEDVLLALHREQKLPLVIFRPGIVIGRGGCPLHWGIGMWQHDSICQVWGEGDNKLPLVTVDDVVQGIFAGIEAPPSIHGASFNLIGDPCLSANEYLDELERLAGMKLQRYHTPIAKFYALDMFKWMVKVLVKHPEHIMPSYRDWASRTQMAVFDCTKAKQQLGWRPEVSRERLIERGIGEPAREWFR